MRKQLEKNYNPAAVEDRLYKEWSEKNYFHSEVDDKKKPFTVMMPPPNITGQLHMGHALDNTIQDILTRTKRMQGYNALWMPGTDHASISTELKIVEKMKEEGLTKAQIGREEFVKRAWDWRGQYGSRIVEQLKKLGSSCDWERERFTMDDGLSKAVNHVFITLYKKGLIYRGEKLINWCPRCKTSISDAEADHADKAGFFYHMKYEIKGTGEYLQFATTRPETILGDTAIAVNPDDERYIKYIGKTAIVPIVNREIPVIADDYVDRDFGTGVVKITPAHDPNDFEVGERHNLPRINIFNDDGTLNSNAGKYEGLDRFEARKKIIAEFEELGLFVKKVEITHAVGVHERCGEVIEPLIKLQWFVKMQELAEPAIDVYKAGKLRIIPDRFGKIYLNWLENIRDWCISRQLWWGHRIPAYYCEACGHTEVSDSIPEKCSKCGCTGFVQDEDTLDTWFSSALWPFSTLGWPEKTPELDYYYPTSVLVTAYDIIFFWVVRMVFSGLEHMGDVPFWDVFIHGLVRDSQGRKMSKSLGNGIEPLEIIDKYGADALRLTLLVSNSPGNDMRFYLEKVEASRNFTNKLWNAARFVLMNLDEDEHVSNPADDIMTNLLPADKWILSLVNKLTVEVTENINNYELGIAVQKVYDFIWDQYCDWYIEMVKTRLYDKEDPSRGSALWTLTTVLIRALKLLHPFMPFVTEEIFMSVQSAEPTIMLSAWPVHDPSFLFEKEEKEIDLIKEAIKGIRNIRTEMNATKKTKIYVVSSERDIREVFEKSKGFFINLAHASEVIVNEDMAGIADDTVSVIVAGATLYLPFAELVDIAKETERLSKERERLKKEIAMVTGKLSNEGFIAKAPDNVITAEKEKQVKYETMLKQVEEQLEKYK